MDSAAMAQGEIEEHMRFFKKFLNSNRDYWEKKIDTMVDKEQYRVKVNLTELRKAEGHLDRKVLENPVKYILPWEEALLAFYREVNSKAATQLRQPLKIEIVGAMGRNQVTPRGVTSVSLGQLLCVEGIVTKRHVSQPKLLQSIHVRSKELDGFVESRDHRDGTSFVNQPYAGAMPKVDGEGNPLMQEIGLSVYKKTQKFMMQETPENTPAGQIPRYIEVVCEGDLAERVKPGERVQVTGVYRSFPPPLADFTNGVFPARLVATSLKETKDLSQSPFNSYDVQRIREVGARDDVFELLSRSFAPSICGHERVKSGLLLQAIGGTEKNLSNGTHLRGDINILLIGDPSCGKSQMLRFVMNTAKLAISTTGKGSSGVGLTAAMVREPGSNEFTVEAGAMVLADRGVICIDEFDKMGEADRVAIHEAMEQQCVTLSKAGMQLTLNSRCSVLAAANPIYGNFDPTLDLPKNIGMPDSLLSRFDLIYVVRDLTTEEIDRKIATQVIRQAQMRAGINGGRLRGVEQLHSSILERGAQHDSEDEAEEKEYDVFQDMPPGPDGDEMPSVVTVDFLRKYLRFCKRFNPVLNEDARTLVAEKYVDMRGKFQTGFMDQSETRKPRLAVTTRSLEALIRLATAHAKCKLRSDYVLPEDVDVAYKLMLDAREEEVIEAVPPDAGATQDGEEVQASQDAEGTPSRPRKRQKTKANAETGNIITPARMSVLQTLVSASFGRITEHEIAFDKLFSSVNGGLSAGEDVFSEEEFRAGLADLEKQNKVMQLDDTIFLVG